MVFVFKCTLMIQFRRFTQPQALRMISKSIARVRPGLKGKAPPWGHFQLAAHAAAAAGDYRGPPHELGHVRPPLRAGADPDMATQPTLFAGRGVKGSPDRATNFTTSSTERGEPRLGTGKQALLRTARDPFRVAAYQQRRGRAPTTRYGKFESISLQRRVRCELSSPRFGGE